MIEWKDKFRKTTLDKGKKTFDSGRVADLEQDGALYMGAILGRQRYEVSAVIKEGKILRMSCHCPIARGGGYCEHMAALLYAFEDRDKVAAGTPQEPEEETVKAAPARVKASSKQTAIMEERRRKREEKKAARKAAQQKQEEQDRLYKEKMEQERLLEEKRRKEAAEAQRRAAEEKYKLLNQETIEETEGHETEEDLQAQDVAIGKLESYRYFDSAKILNSLEIPSTGWKDGERILAQGKLRLTRVSSGFDRKTGKPAGMIEAEATEKKASYSMNMCFTQDEVISRQCDCPECRKKYYRWYDSNLTCKYLAATALSLKKYLDAYPLADATDMNGSYLLSAYNKKQFTDKLTEMESDAESGSVYLTPRLTRKDGKLYLSFKVGKSKMYVVKNLEEFCQKVKEGADGEYGTSAVINHRLSNFTEQGQTWIRYIIRIVQEEGQFLDKLEQSGYSLPKKFSVGGNLELFGWRLDGFYDRLGKETAEFEDKSPDAEKKKGTITCGEGNPRVDIHIKAIGKKTMPDGVRVEGELPDIYYGMDRAYYLENDKLYRTDEDFQKKAEPLTEMARHGKFSFVVGRSAMSGFYHNLLPQLQEFAQVEEESQEVRKYLTPEPRFVFLLDIAKDGDVICALKVFYGGRQFSVPKSVHTRHWEPYRDQDKEGQVFDQLVKWMPVYDEEEDVLHVDWDEERLYSLINEGLDTLMSLGEVRCTDQFQHINAVRKVKVSVGVSVSRGLLDLDVTTDDISGKELLEILKSYRVRKKYHRLKSGEFVNLDEPSLEMLSEMMEGLQLSPKEFAKGKMHIPMFRTLYLDQLLEENGEVYSDRDRHFREIVKGFKTVKDADFEEPESLSKIMRKYQKDGFKWLKTLEAWKFGGILADDMGLGKTLQMIAVFLSAKLEGKAGTSLVVAPAALVYNWGEELAKFAPQLSVVLVTGTQEERRKKLEHYTEADVLVTSYDLLKRDIDQYEDKEFLYQVIDEAQYIKNHNTAAAKAVKVIKSRMRYALTGTPIENRLSELWSIFDYLMPGFLYGYEVFKKEIETPIVKNGDEEAMNRLRKMVGPFILRRLKQDVLKDLPEKLEETRYVKLEGEQLRLYDGQVVHMKESLAGQNEKEFNQNKLQVLAELTRLRQICCSPSLAFENYRGESAKADACLQLVQSAIDGGHRMLIFSQFTSMLEILQERLGEQGISYYIITGATPKHKRLELVKDFNSGDVPVFLISLKAGGVGLNLTGADVVIHYDPWWNLAVQNQATDRAHRIGQEKKVTIYKLIAKNTIEEKIQKLQEAKSDLADQVISGGTGQLGSMSKEDILELLQ